MSTREKILEAGLQLWRMDPSKVNPFNVAKMIGKTHASIYHHFKDSEHLKRAVAVYGLQKGDSVVIVTLMLVNDPLVASLSEDERQKHLNMMKEYGTSSEEPAV